MNNLEFSELRTVDIALSAVIKGAFDNLAHTNSDSFNRLLDKEPQRWMFRIDKSTASEVLKEIRAARKGEGKRHDLPDLPIVNYFRPPTISNGDRVAKFPYRVGYGERLAASVKAKLLPLALDYTIMFIAWDKQTVELMQLAWYAYVTTRQHTRFVAPIKFCGDDDLFHLPCSILDPKSIMFDDISEKSPDRRLYAISTQITVETTMLVGSGIEIPDPITIIGECTSYIKRFSKKAL
jgi:hypothetical protein